MPVIYNVFLFLEQIVCEYSFSYTLPSNYVMCRKVVATTENPYTHIHFGLLRKTFNFVYPYLFDSQKSIHLIIPWNKTFPLLLFLVNYQMNREICRKKREKENQFNLLEAQNAVIVYCFSSSSFSPFFIVIIVIVAKLSLS